MPNRFLVVSKTIGGVMRPTTRMRQQLNAPGTVIGGGAYDALTARIVEDVGFAFCHITGAGVAMSRGYPDIGLITVEEMVTNARYVAEAVDIPVIADADNGYGNALNTYRTIRSFEAAGVAGVHIEDQVWPKRCGHMFGKKVIDTVEMVQKIHAALDARRDPDFLVMARCDALMVNGLEDALSRGEAYLEAGADILFFEMRESMEEIVTMANQFRGRIHLHFNHSASGMVPMLHADEVAKLGFKTLSYPLYPIMAVCKTVREVMTEIKRTGNATSIQDRMVKFSEFWEIAELSKLRGMEERYKS